MKEDKSWNPKHASLFEQHARELVGAGEFEDCRGYTLKGDALIWARMRFAEECFRALISARRQCDHLDRMIAFETIPEENGKLRRKLERWRKWIDRLNGWRHDGRLSSFTPARK